MKKITALLLLMFTCVVNAQLSNFTLSLSKTDETCLGNGTITFNTGNTTSGAAMLYKVYLLPDTTNAVAILTSNYISGLSAGVYKVVAIQSLGSQMATKEQSITINNNITPFAFTISATNQYCQSGGTLTINTTSGTFAGCEIISGPVPMPLQSSNIFNNLPSGTYNIRAFNDCGVGKVKTYTLYVTNATLNISDTAYPDLTSALCDSITVTNTITPSVGTINYPLTVQHTVNAMDINGDEMVIDQVFETGSPDALDVTVVLPRYMTESYTYDITVSDNCNTVYQKLDNEVDPDISLALSVLNAPCAEKYLKLTASKYTGAYTVEFLSVPEGFNPADFNATPAGPFAENSILYGSATNPVPFGNYVVKITDSCGRTTTESLLIEFKMPTPSANAWNNGCFSEYGGISVSVPPQKIIQATITAAPATFTGGTLPMVVNGNINAQGTLNLYNMPLGLYTITFTDNCGFEYSKTISVPVYVEKEFDIAALPACEAGFGSVRYRSGNGDLTNVKITMAPPTFGQSLPYDVSANLTADGDFYMGNLPEGTYKFIATDICGLVKEKEVNVEGYIAPQTPFIYTANCGTFAVRVTDTGNGLEGSGYWLQKYFPDTNTWGHPGTGVAYNFADVPTDANSIKLLNNTTKNNLGYSGKFRIVKKFETFTTGSAQNTVCVSILGEFTYNDVLKINTAYTLACIGNPNDVMLDVTGQPVSYKIVEKNGEAYTFDNGNNNIFVNLEPAEYVFKIEDLCGNVVQKWFNVQSMPSIADATQPADLVLCTEPGTTTGEFHLTDQNDDVLGPLHSSMYTLTYHLNYEDADNGVNALPEYYTNITNGQTIYARLVHNEIALCHGITSFKLFVGQYQEPLIITSGTICNDGELTLTVAKNYDSYLWSTGETTRAIKVSEPGVYTVIVEKTYGTGHCDGFAEYEIKESATPKIKKIETEDWTEDNNTIIVHTLYEGEYEYSLDGITYQSENTFTGLGTGKFTVYVKDLNGCGQDIKEVVLLNYPRFFTPNGDGINDNWYIKYAAYEPHFHVTIMDRYGKLITTFGSTSKGWDGTLNSIQLPSTDYWFVVTREDGRELRGHFSMVR